MVLYSMNEEKNLKIIKFLLGFIVLSLLIASLFLLRSVFIPLIIAVVLAILAQPFLYFFNKRLKVPYYISVTLFILSFILLVFIGGVYFGSRVNAFAGKVDEYRVSYTRLYERYADDLKPLREFLNDEPFNLDELIDSYKISQEGVAPSGESDVETIPSAENEQRPPFPGANLNLTDNPIKSRSIFSSFDWAIFVKPLVSISGTLVNFLGELVLIILYLLFILMEKRSFSVKICNMFLGKRGEHVRSVSVNISSQIVRYLNIKVLISALTGFCVYIVCFIVGLDFPFMWAIIAFVLNFIPSLGSIIFFLMASVMSIIQFLPDERWGAVLTITISVGLIEFIIGNILDPKISGDKLDLSPLVIVVSLLFWGFMWGIVGMFLAVPLMLFVKLVCENIPSLKPVSVFLGSGKAFEDKKEGSIDRFFKKIKAKVVDVLPKKGKKISEKKITKGEKDNEQ